MNDSPPLIVGLGEALYDLLPTGPALGGAPLNAAVQSHQLGNRAVVASRIGGDALGQALLHDLTTRGMDTAFIQRDPAAPTGTVEVILRNGEPEYDIVRNVAWDRLAWDESLASLAKQCDAVCFGTLGQRFEPAHSTIRQFAAASQSVRLFDLNLRQDFFSAELLETGCRAASIVKMNETELATAVSLLGLGQAEGSNACPPPGPSPPPRFAAALGGRGPVPSPSSHRISARMDEYEGDLDGIGLEGRIGNLDGGLLDHVACTRSSIASSSHSPSLVSAAHATSSAARRRSRRTAAIWAGTVSDHTAVSRKR